MDGRRIINRTESKEITFNKRMLIDLIWSSWTEFDLCLFWKKMDGNTGGVFSCEFNHNKEDIGSLHKFPFIQIVGDQKPLLQGEESIEQIMATNIDDLSELYIVVINYQAALEDKNVTFNKHNACIEITTDTGNNSEISLDSSNDGYVYNVCKIENADSAKKITFIGDVLSVTQAFYQMPGYESICNR